MKIIADSPTSAPFTEPHSSSLTARRITRPGDLHSGLACAPQYVRPQNCPRREHAGALAVDLADTDSSRWNSAHICKASSAEF